MNNKMIYLVLTILACLLIAIFFIKSNNKKITYKWQPWCTAPRMFTVYTHYFYVKYGDDKAVGIGDEYIHSGINYFLGVEAGIVKNEIPTGIRIIYAALQERKIYEADIHFSNEELDLLRDRFENGYMGQYERDYFTQFDVCILPGGRLKFIIVGDRGDRVEVLPFEYTATDTHIIDDDIKLGMNSSPNRGLEWWSDTNEYFDFMNHEGKNFMDLEAIKERYGEEVYERTKFLREQNFPMEIWESYFERYNYEIAFLFEDEKSILSTTYLQYSNVECVMIDYEVNPANIINSPSCIRQIEVWWFSKGQEYKAYLYFNEKEIIQTFQTAFGDDHNKKGTLNINVCKFNNLIDISLNVEDNTYKLNSTQIVILTIDSKNGDRKAIYKNWEESDHQQFLGFE